MTEDANALLREENALLRGSLYEAYLALRPFAAIWDEMAYPKEPDSFIPCSIRKSDLARCAAALSEPFAARASASARTDEERERVLNKARDALLAAEGQIRRSGTDKEPEFGAPTIASIQGAVHALCALRLSEGAAVNKAAAVAFEKAGDVSQKSMRYEVCAAPVAADAERERLAALAHEQWSGWMRYLFSKCVRLESGLTIPEWAVERWSRQVDTPYAKLPAEEQESDREEADRVLALLASRPDASDDNVRDKVRRDALREAGDFLASLKPEHLTRGIRWLQNTPTDADIAKAREVVRRPEVQGAIAVLAGEQ